MIELHFPTLRFNDESDTIYITFLVRDSNNIVQIQERFLFDEIQRISKWLGNIITFQGDKIIIDSFFHFPTSGNLSKFVIKNTLPSKRIGVIYNEGVAIFFIDLINNGNLIVKFGFNFNDENSLYLGLKEVVELKNKMDFIINTITKNQSPLIYNKNTAYIEVQNKAKIQWIMIQVDGAVFDKNEPNISLNLFGEKVEGGFFHSWAFTIKEAEELMLLLENALNNIEKSTAKNFGKLGNWLTLNTVSRLVENENKRFVELIFEDELFENNFKLMLQIDILNLKKLKEDWTSMIKYRKENMPYIFGKDEPLKKILLNLG